MSHHDRRTFLRSIGAASLGVLAAGCSGDGDGTDTEEPTDEPTDTAAATDSPTPTQAETPTATATTTEAGTETATETPAETATVTPGEADYTAGSETTALHDPRDGFSEIAHWVEDEWQDVQVNRVTEPTRRSLEGAIIGTEPRVVVFETSGTIDLGSRGLTIGQDKCWIAGQTAPSPGVTLTHGRLVVEANDCVVQHLRVRPGDENISTPDSTDAIFTQDETENNVIDHCTTTWSTDENLSVGYDTNNTTVTNCLIAEPLNDSIHSKGPHGYGSLTGNNAKNVFYGGNVWLQGVERNPRLKIGTETTVVNNLIHYYGDGMWADPDTAHSIVGNVLEKPQTDQPHIFARNEGGGEVYAEDNVAEGDNPMVGDKLVQLDERPLWPDGLEAASSGEVKEANLTHAGARPADRSEHDQRIVQKIRDGNVDDWVDSQEEVGGYPELEENTRELDVPADVRGGLRAWLREHAQQVEPSA